MRNAPGNCQGEISGENVWGGKFGMQVHGVMSRGIMSVGECPDGLTHKHTHTHGQLLTSCTITSAS